MQAGRADVGETDRGGASSASVAGGGFEAGAAPRDDPLAYPGAHPSFSFLFTGIGIERLDEVDAEGREATRLHDRLAALGAAPMASRQPVLAYGSNRSPAQLRSKYGSQAVDPVIPVLRARVDGLSVVFNAAVAGYGSVPAALVADPGAVTEVAVTFLDPDQLAVMDRTEGGHHRPVLDPAHRLRLRSGDEQPCEVYRSTRPVLTWDGHPIRLAEIESSGSELPARSQVEMHEALLAVWAAAGHGDPAGRRFASARSFASAVARDGNLHRRANRALARLASVGVGHLGARPVDAPLGA